MREPLRTIAAVIALAASMPTLLIAVGNWKGFLSDDWAICALILMSFFGLPASAYLVSFCWRERNARSFAVLNKAPVESVVSSAVERGRTKLRLVSST